MQFPGSLLCIVSEPPCAALRQAVSLAGATGTPLHVLPTVPTETARGALQSLLSSMPRDDFDVRFAPSVDSILTPHVQRYVLEHDVGLVVADTPPDRGPVPPLAASETKGLVEALGCSLFIVEHNADPHSIHRVLVPADLSTHASHDLTCAASLADAYGATLDLLHVIETVPYVALTRVDRLSLSATSFPERRARRRLSALLEDLSLDNDTVNLHFEYGDPADQIGRFVNQHAVDLLVLSSHDGPSSSPVAPVVDRVLRRVTCPSVLVRPSDDTLSDAPQSSSTAENG